MERFSVVLSELGWSAKCLDTGKELIGRIDDMPDSAYYDLIEQIRMSPRSICTAAQIEISHNSPFTIWFRVTHKYI